MAVTRSKTFLTFARLSLIIAEGEECRTVPESSRIIGPRANDQEESARQRDVPRQYYFEA